jgi:NAD(P)-dependent dehydrogenase (short-subunit alcohol dehydrogenase family)
MTDASDIAGTAHPLASQTALVTGGGGGIGRATAELLVRDGAHVTISGRTAEKLETVAARLAPLAEAAGGSIRTHVCDVLDDDQVRDTVAFASAPTGRIDMTVAVPGGGKMAPVLRYSTEALEATMRANITSAYILLRHAGSAMVRQGGGSFVAISSMQAIQAAPMFAAYCAAKAGLEMLCKCAAEELGHHRVRVNIVRPGFTRTDATVGMFSDDTTIGLYLAEQPIDRPGEALDIAGAVRYFLGPESTWTTGQTMTVDGGNTLRRFPDLGHLYRQRIGDEIDRAERGELLD